MKSIPSEGHMKDEKRGGVGLGGAILVAEDDRHDVMLLKRALAKAEVGLPVRFVWDGEEAVNYLQGQPPYNDRRVCPLPSVVVLDLTMPRMGGFDVLEWIRARRELDKLAVVMWSGTASAADTAKAYHLGADVCFVKQTDPEGIKCVAEQIKQVALVGGRAGARASTAPC